MNTPTSVPVYSPHNISAHVAVCWNNNNNNNNNNNYDNVYGAVIMTTVIARDHPVHLMNERRVAANPQTKPTDLGCESAENWL